MSGHIKRRILPKSGNVRYEPTLKGQYLGSFERKRDAEMRLRQAQDEAISGKPKQSDITFAEFAADWLATKAGPHIRPRVKHDYETIIRRHFIPAFGAMPLRDIGPGDVDAHIASKVAQGLAPATINKQRVLLRAIFTTAEERDLITSSPARNVKRLTETAEEMQCFTVEEVQRMLAAAEPEHYPLLLTAVMTGLRQGEQLALIWGDIDLENNLLYVRRTYHPRYGFGEPKSKQSRRVVHFSQELSDVLGTIKGSPDELVFPGSNGNPMDQSNLLSNIFFPTLERAGLRRIRWHDLRHTYATHTLTLSGNIKFLQKQMGHASITMTIDQYGHLLPETAKGEAEKLGSLFFDQRVVPFGPQRLEEGEPQGNAPAKANQS